MLLVAEILKRLRLVVYPCLSHDLQAFTNPRWLFGISDPSTVPLPTAIDNSSHRQNSVDTLDVWLSQLAAMQPERRINSENAIKTRPGASIEITHQKTNMSMENPTMNEDLYFLLNMGIFQCLVFGGVYTHQYTQ